MSELPCLESEMSWREGKEEEAAHQFRELPNIYTEMPSSSSSSSNSKLFNHPHKQEARAEAKSPVRYVYCMFNSLEPQNSLSDGGKDVFNSAKYFLHK
jgi:hypothetical protein